MKVIITGSSGMVGKGVLLECLDSDNISEVLLINRSPIDIQHPKIKEILLQDFTDFNGITLNFKGYNACFHCMGVTSAGINENLYYKLTFTVTEALANAVYQSNPNITFIYVSGDGTDSTETSKTMWARVKGKTENYIFNKGFKDVYAFRPGVILPKRGVTSKTRWYNLFYKVTRPFFVLLERIKSVTTTEKLGQAMIALLENPQHGKILTGSEINNLASNR